LKILFFGSSEISVPFLEEIYKSSHSISMVVTVADKPAGRGRKITPNIVKSKAVELGIDFMQVEGFDDSFFNEFKKLEFDTVVIASFGKILPEKIFKLTSALWLNVHPSLLPRYRGPTPIISTLLNGDKVGGVSIIEVVHEVDAGGIYAQVKFGVEEDDNRDSLESKVVKFGKQLLMTVLELVENKALEPYPQDEENVIYSHKITKEDLEINWDNSAVEIVNKVRAFSSNPGAYCIWKGSRIKILKAGILNEDISKGYLDKLKNNGNKKNGFLIEADKKTGILVKCNKNEMVKVELLQPQGGKAMSVMDFVNGYRLEAGESFE
jgi:methionyl-tRNA formyltransferase